MDNSNVELMFFNDTGVFLKLLGAAFENRVHKTRCNWKGYQEFVLSGLELLCYVHLMLFHT